MSPRLNLGDSKQEGENSNNHFWNSTCALIRPKRIYNFSLLHASFVWYCYHIDALPYTFDHIWTNLLTQCTTVPVPVFCCFSISGFPHIKSALKIPGKIQEKSAYRELQEKPKQGQRGAWGGPGGHPARPHPWPRQGGAWGPGSASGDPPSYIYSSRRENPDSRTLFSRSNSDLRRHRHQVSGDQNSCAGILPGRGSAPGFISIDVASSLHDAGVVPPRGWGFYQ